MRHARPGLPFVIVGLVTALCGWREPADAQEPGAAGNPTVRVAEDHSLAPDQYVAKGVPAPDRDWSGRDYLLATQVLRTVAAGDPTRLPRSGSPKSAKLFARFHSADNLRILGDKALPLDARMSAGLDLLEGTKQLLMVYVEPTAKGPSFDAELVALYGLVLRESNAMLALITEFMPRIRKDDPTYETRMQGLEQMKRGLANTFNGALTTLTERSTYRVPELLKLALVLKETLPACLYSLPPLSRQEISVTLKRMVGAETDESMKAALSDLLHALPEAEGKK